MRALDPANITPPPRAPGGNGPFITSLIAAIICTAAFLTGLLLGMKLSLTILFTIIIPAVTLAVLLIASSMGWVFLMVGRSNLQPRRLPAAIVMIFIAMAELLAIIVISGRAGGPSGGFYERATRPD